MSEPITLEPLGGDDIHDVLSEAVATAISKKCDVTFTFNDHTFTATPGDSLAVAKKRWLQQTGIEALTRDESAKRARDGLAKMEREQAEAISKAGAMTEKELRDFDPPWPKSEVELAKFIASLVDRPHDYGTCVYAMSLSAVAAFHYVASKLGVTGFQASCADMDILRRTRGLKHPFRIVDYGKLLYPQYLDDEDVPGWRKAINEADLRSHLRKAAAENLESKERAYGEVADHWRKLVSEESF